MPRYYFNLEECGTLTPDEEGLELRNLEAAKHAATVAARDVMCGEIAEGRLCLSCRIDVTNSRGKTVFSLPFKDAIKITGLNA